MIQEQKSAVRSASNVWGFASSIGTVAINVIVIAAAFVLRLTGLNADLFQNPSPTVELIMQIVLSFLLMTVPFIIGALATRERISALLSVRRVRAGLFIPLVFIGLGGAMLSNFMTNSFISFMNMLGLNPSSGELQIPDGVGGTALFLVTISVLPAIIEEFAYRGIVMGALRKFGNSFAIIASSVLFGLMHGNFVQIPFAIALGCVMGYINIVSGSILPSVTVHFLNNFMSGIQQIIYIRYGEEYGTVAVVICFCLSLALGILGFFILCKRFRHPFAPIIEECPIGLKTALCAFLSCPGSIVSYIVFGGSAVVMLLPFAA